MNEIVDLILYFICCLGVSYAWSDTDAAVPFRNFVSYFPYIRKPLLCHECSSFWISLGISFLINPIKNSVSPYWVSNIILAFCGFFINLYFIRNKKIPYREYL
jgi:hypothetical protein